MTNDFHRRLDGLRNSESYSQLASSLRGVEKEGLRINSSGELATTPHPTGLGSPLTNSSITTDFSEALLELVTKPHGSIDAAINELANLHQFTYSQLDEETIWASSMPCIVPDDESIPIADYGSSNVGRMKSIYRIGLGHRYGRAMQTIAGIHYNYSYSENFWLNDALFGDYDCDLAARASHGYMALTRNFHRHCWLLMYLFGASPAVCESFLKDRNHRLDTLSRGTLYLPYATSLRMSDIGYQNSAQDDIYIDLNSVQTYAASLINATSTEYPAYQKLGVKVEDQYRQLNANLLQIENEYYAVIRPKRIAMSGEKPSRALLERGVEYVEVRCLDIDPFEAVGISKETMHFIDAFCLYCLLDNSPPLDASENSRIGRNRLNVVKDGRRPDFQLEVAGDGTRPLTEMASEILDRVSEVATVLDATSEHFGKNNANDAPEHYSTAVRAQRLKIENPANTPSARVLLEIQEHNESFFDFANRWSRKHAAYFANRQIEPQVLHNLKNQAEESIGKRRALETADEVGFDTYLERYFNT